jgi:hypothetical protein
MMDSGAAVAAAAADFLAIVVVVVAGLALGCFVVGFVVVIVSPFSFRPNLSCWGVVVLLRLEPVVLLLLFRG